MSKRKKYIAEKLNPDFGYFYKVKKHLAKKKTKYQNIELVDTNEFGKVLLLDKITQVGEKNEYLYHEPMVHPALCSHPNPKDILIIGAGDGGILREVLKHNSVKNVDMVELDAGVVEFSKKYLFSINRGAFLNKKAKVIIDDGRQFVKNTKKRYDVIIMDMTDPFGPSIMLYTKEFFRMAKRTFKDKKGIFVMHSESPISRPEAFNCINKTLKSVFKNVNIFYIYIQMYATLWSVSVCSGSIDTSKIKASRISKVLRGRKVGKLHAYSGITHTSMQAEFPFVSDLRKNPSKVITDKDHKFPDKIDCNLNSNLTVSESRK